MMQLVAWIVLGWVFTSCVATFGWCGFVEVCRRQERRRELALPHERQRGLRLVGNQALTSSAASKTHVLPGEDAAQGTAPYDRASILVPDGGH